MSVERTFLESNTGKAARAKVSAFEREKAKELETRQLKLQQQSEAFKQRAPLLDEGARQAGEQELLKFEIDIRRFSEDAQAQFLGVQREAESAFLARLRPAVRQVARSKDLLLVFNEDVGLFTFADSSLDITADVIKALDQP